MEIIQSKKQKKNFFNENILMEHWDNIKNTNICIIGVPEGEDREKGVKNVFDEIIAEKFPNLKKKADIQVQESESQTRWTQKDPYQDIS